VSRLLLICLGGAIGTAGRYLAGALAARLLGVEFPWGTMAVNLVGAFLIGLVQQVAAEASLLSEDLRLFLVTGILGGFTTYSAFTYETLALARLEAWPQALGNVVVTTVGCLLLCGLGMATARALVPAG
jgi:CrcB protein